MPLTTDFVVAIPARLGSTRLAEKPLRLLAGEPMIVHVMRRAQEAGAREVVVATDDARIAEVVRGHGGDVCMTSASHQSGTDRIAECARSRGWADDCLVVNLQGDEPLAPPAALTQVATLLAASAARIATLAQPIIPAEQVFDPNCVKVVCRDDGEALYFSRAPIPFDRDGFARNRLKLGDHGWLRHIGLYAYRVVDLCRFSAMPAARLEHCEALEQLRALQAGWRIAVGVFDQPFPAGVDTEADLQRVDRLLRGAGPGETVAEKNG